MIQIRTGLKHVSLFIFTTFISHSHCCSDQSGYQTSPSHTCWKFISSSMNWNDASANCFNTGGKLATINNAYDYLVFYNFTGGVPMWTNLKHSQCDNGTNKITNYRTYSSTTTDTGQIPYYPNIPGDVCCDRTTTPQCCLRTLPSCGNGFYDTNCDATTQGNFDIIQSVCETTIPTSCTVSSVQNLQSVGMCCDGTANVNCQFGFFPSTWVANCVGTNWNVVCTAQCPLITIPYGTPSYADSNRRNGSTATIQCQPGAVMFGNVTLKCVDHTWSPNLPQCINYCQTINISNGYVNYSSTKTPYDNGTTAQFVCNSGDTPTGSATVTCLDSGLWTALPSCPQICKNLSDPANGTTILSDTTRAFDTVANFTCFDKFDLFDQATNITCQTNSTWSGDVPTCLPYCSSNPCQNGGTCTDEPRTFSCACVYGYLGKDCGIVNRCLVPNQQKRKKRFISELQEIVSNATDDNMESLIASMGYLTSDNITNTCDPHGFCVMNNDSQVGCICYYHFYGDKCEQKNCSTYEWAVWSQCADECSDQNKQTRKRVDADDCPVESKSCPCDDPLTPAERLAVRVIHPFNCSLTIAIVSTCFFIFLFFRIFTVERVLQMGQEISLIIAHIIIFTQIHQTVNMSYCVAVAVSLQYFFIVHFTFITLEALQTFSILQNVVSIDGYFSRKVNIAIGCGVPALLVLTTAPFLYKEYTSKYSCWLNMGSKASLSTLVPLMASSMCSLVLAEAATINEVTRFPLTIKEKFNAAMISQKGLTLKIVFNWAAWLSGTLAVYHQNVATYSVVLGFNITLSTLIFILHSFSNEFVHSWLASKFCKKKT